MDVRGEADMGSLDGLPGDGLSLRRRIHGYRIYSSLVLRGTAIMERRARFGSEMFSGGVVISFRHGAGGNSEQN